MLNIHSIIRSSINSVHPDMECELFQSLGQTVMEDGTVKNDYAKALKVWAQVQTLSAQNVQQMEKVNIEQVSRKFYLYSDAALKDRVAAIVRPLGRTGDFIRIVQNGTWWLINSVLEDFTNSGWVCVAATLQVKPPDFARFHGDSKRNAR